MTPEIVYTIWQELRATSAREFLYTHPEELAQRLISILLSRGVLTYESTPVVKDYVVSRVLLNRDLLV